MIDWNNMKWNCLLIIGVLIASMTWACSSKEKSSDDTGGVSTVLPNEKNIVSAIQLKYSDFKQELISTGIVTSAKKVDLRFETNETVAAIYVKNGDHVSAGETIAELDQYQLKNALAQASDNLARAQLELQDVLIGQGYSIKDTSKVPPAVMKIAKVRSNYDQSNILYHAAQHNLTQAKLRAPFAGIVANLFTQQYDVSKSSEPFCTLIDNRSLQVAFTVLENELPLIRNGDDVLVSAYAINNYSVKGTIVEINPMVDENGMVKVKALLKDANKLYDGMKVKIKIQRTLSKQLVIPKAALVLRSNKKVVFTIKNMKAQWVYVQTSLENSEGYVVTEGLQEGDSVIYKGNINLAHDAPIELAP